MKLARKFDASPDGAAITQPFLLSKVETMAGFLVCDSQGRVAICSPSAAQVLGTVPSDIEGKPIDILLHESEPSGSAPVLRHIDLAGLSGKIGWHRFDTPRTSGRKVPVSVSVERLEVDRVGYFLLRLHRL
jgi:PAS domain S-box-containing protein